MDTSSLSYRFLGRSGVKVSPICLGTMTFGQHDSTAIQRPTQLDEEHSHQLLNRYVELGGNFLDTANVYSFGRSEEIIGSWLKKQERDRIVLATKVRFNMDPTGSRKNAGGLSRRHIIKSCEQSLERLQTDYIDLLQGHIWDAGTPLEETLRTFDDLIKAGKIRYFGYSNLCGWQIQKVTDLCKQMSLNPCISLQQHYCLLNRNSELEAFAVCEQKGLAILPWSPLKGGLLTGKFQRSEVPSTTGSRVGYMATKSNLARASHPTWAQYCDSERYWKLMDVLKDIAQTHGRSVAQVSIRWLLQKRNVASTIIGATSLQQLEDNMGAAGNWELSTEQMDLLDSASEPEDEYPYEMIRKSNGADRYNVYI